MNQMSANYKHENNKNIFQLRKDTIQYMIDRRYWEQEQDYILISQLKEAIEAVRCRSGSNIRARKRTVNHWIKELRKGGIIKENPIGPGSHKPNNTCLFLKPPDWHDHDDSLLDDEDLKKIHKIKEAVKSQHLSLDNKL